MERAPSGVLALLVLCGVVRKLASLKHAPTLIRPTLRCSARSNGIVSKRSVRSGARSLARTSGSHLLRLLLVPTVERDNVPRPHCSFPAAGAKQPNGLLKAPLTPAGVRGWGMGEINKQNHSVFSPLSAFFPLALASTSATGNKGIPKDSRTLFSISIESSGFSRKNSRALSRP